MEWLNEFADMLRVTFNAESTVTPFLILALAALLIFGFELWRRRYYSSSIPTQWPVGALAIAPLAMTLWGTIWYAADEGVRGGQWTWRSIILVGMLATELVICGWVIYRLRRWPWLAIPLSIASLLWAGLSCFVAGMALANDWL
jgi:hypothetical protein